MVAQAVAAAPAVSSGVGSIIGGLGGSILGGLFGRSSAKRSMAFQKQMAQKGHQWEVADLRAAGLNPILSGTGGPGAKASGGAMPTTPDFASSALNALRNRAEIDNIRANTLLTLTKEGQERPGGEFGRDIDMLYKKAKGVASAMDVKKAASDYQKALTKTPSSLQKRIDEARAKSKKKPGYHIGVGGNQKTNPSWYQFK